MQSIIKKKDYIIEAGEIKNKLYNLNVGEQLTIQTQYTTRIFERVI